ncbi:hypothetical protein NPA08_02580 [Mycoplasmopsis citelli]|uniref:hypothetical protein n=1 Tax=Mycoplasmopsis citelli TaxID=171281 RepID=UPI002114B17E|nr:hypothetical protein [Mycoplasmopsis citelli]UUD35831.1 hypothetical protein NPA08_02580 [Mycoplasmopsis citelli]
MKKANKAVTSLAIATGITGAGAIASVGTVLSLHNNYTNSPKQTYFFVELKNQVDKTTAQLKKLSKSEKNNKEIKDLYLEVDYANQLLANENSSIATMLQQRNKLRHSSPKALLNVAKDSDEEKNLLEEYYSLIKDVDFQSSIKNAKEKVLSQLSTPNKQDALKAFYEVVDPLIEQQNDFSIGLETKIWNNHEQLIKNITTKFSSQEKSALFSTIDQILNLLNQPQYSRDALVEYEKVYDQMITKLSKDKEKSNKSLNNFLENVIKVRNEVIDLKANESLKNNFLDRIDNYKNQALSPTPTLALDKDKEISYLNDLVNNQLQTIIKETPDTNKLLQTLSASLNNLKSISNDSQIQKLVNLQIQKIQNNPKETQGDILNSIVQATNLVSSVKNIENLINSIKSQIGQYLNNKTLSNIDADSFSDSLSSIINSDFDNIDQYLEKLNSLHNDIYDNDLLASLFRNSLSKLNEQVLDSLIKGFNIDKKSLSEINFEIKKLLDSNPSVKQLNEALWIQSNKLREINRIELKNWYDFAQSFITVDDDNLIAIDIKNQLKFLNKQAETLIPINSTAIREDLQRLIKLYQEARAKIHISEGYEKALLQFTQTKNSISKVFANENKEINSPFGQNLFNQVQELRKQSQITTQNPTLTNKQKEAKFKEISNSLNNLAITSVNWKQLENLVTLGDETLDSSKDKKAEQAYLESEILKFKAAKNSILRTLNNAANVNNLDDLIDQITQAIKDYKDKQAEYQSTKAPLENTKEINDTFAPYSVNGNPTQMQKKILDKLVQYQEQLALTTLSNTQREQTNQQIAQLMDTLQSAKDLEVKNNTLKALVKDTEHNDYSNFAPTSEFNKAKQLNNEVDSFIETLFNPNFDKNQINAKIVELNNSHESLSLAISVALLKKTNKEIQDNKVSDPNLMNKEPYLDINTSIESINTETNNLIDSPTKTQVQVDELNNQIKNYLKLAQALKLSATLLAQVDENNSPIAYTTLVNAITNKPLSGNGNEPINSLIKFGDSLSVIDFKTRILKDEIAKTQSRIEAQNHLKTLQNVYTSSERNRAIFDHAISVYDVKTQSYEEQIGQFYNSKGNLVALRDEIDFYIQNATDQKNEIEKAWDAALSLKNSKKTEYDGQKNADGLRTTTHTDKVFADFDSLKDAANTNGKKTTLTAQLLAKLNELPLAYTKDAFMQDSSNLADKLNPFSSYSSEIQNAYSNAWKEIISNWINALKNTVNNYTQTSDLVKIKQDYQKLSALNSLITQFKVVFDYFGKNSQSNPNQSNLQVLTNQRPNNTLFAQLNNKTPYQGTDNDLYTKTPESILNLRNQIRDVYFDNVSLEEAKASELEKIKNYLAEVDGKLNAQNNHIDSSLKTQIDTKLNNLITQTNAVQHRNELINIDNLLGEVQFKENNLKQLAITTKQAENLVSANPNIAPDQVGKQSIINDISNIYNAYKNSYLSLNSLELISKEQNLQEQMALFNKFVQVYGLVQSEKIKIPMLYHQGTGTQGTPQEGKTKFETYFNNLTTILNTTPITQTKLFNVENTVNSLNNLISIQNEKLNTQNQVLNDHIDNYNNFEYKTGMHANYGFDTDAQKLADIILKSIPDTAKTASEISTVLIPNLVNEFQNQYDLYLARKNSLELLYKNTPTDKGIKTKEVEILYQTGTSNVDSQFNDLKTKADEFFHTQAQTISNATSKAQMDQAIRNAVEIDVFFDKYKQIAHLITQANAKINSLTTLDSSVKNHANVTASKTKLQEQINIGLSNYYTSKDNVALDRNILLLDTYTARLTLAITIAKVQKDLNDFNSNPGNAEYLSVDAKAPLLAIINESFNELANNSNLETKEDYNRLEEKYITGSTDNSYTIAFINSQILQANIYKAQQYLNTYKNHQNTNSNYEPQDIQVLYTQLEAKITEATIILKANPHNEAEKIRISSEIYNSHSGVLDQILKAETEKAKRDFALHLSLSKYIDNHFPNANNSPLLADYKSVALDPLESIDISSASKLETFNENLINAHEKYINQRVAIFKWQAHRYASYKNKFNDFYTLLNSQNTNGASQSFIFETTGITQDDLNAFGEAINPTAADTLHTNAQSYALKASESDANIKTFLAQNNADDIINNLTNVADEFFNYYQNLISIKSIPSILIKISNLSRIKEQLTDLSSTENVRKALIDTHLQTTELETKINDFLSEINVLTIDSQSDIKNEIDESNVSFTTDTPANITTQRQTYFDKYKNIVVALAKAKEKLLNLVFGSNNTDQNTLQKLLNKFLTGLSGFEGRANLNNLLKYLASSDQANPNIAPDEDKFTLVKSEYSKLATPSLTSSTELNNLTPSTASDIDIFSTITNGFDLAYKLFKWTTDPNNTNLFFEYLTQKNGGKFNYEDIIAKTSTTLESFKNTLQGTSVNEEDITIDGVAYKAKKINSYINAQGEGIIGNLFEKFNILKGNDSIFNTDNVEVFAYKSSTDPNAEYVQSRLTSDPKIRRGFIQLYFRFTEPNSVNDNNSAFSNAHSFGVKFENIGINFKTIDTFSITKENISDEDHLNAPLFTAEEAGWNNLEAPARIFSAFNKYSLVKAIQNNTYFYSEDITENIDAPPSTTTTSSPDFRIKVKLTGTYKGYTQVGNQIFWRTLNPNFVSDEGLQYQNKTDYSRKLIGTADQQTYDWVNQYQYKYNASTDQGKNLLFLPFVIGIPMTNGSADGRVLMVITWQILNRFDKNLTSNPQNITLGGTPDVLRHVFFFRRSNSGKTNNATRNDTNFYHYVMNKIGYRDLEGLSFKALNKKRSQNGSRLWPVDGLIQTIENISGKDKGIGESDFTNAIGSNGFFNIKFKVH